MIFSVLFLFPLFRGSAFLLRRTLPQPCSPNHLRVVVAGSHLLRPTARKDTERFKDTNIILKNKTRNADGKPKRRRLKFLGQEAASLMKG